MIDTLYPVVGYDTYINIYLQSILVVTVIVILSPTFFGRVYHHNAIIFERSLP